MSVTVKMVGLVLSVSSEEGGSCGVPVLKDIQAVDVKIQANYYDYLVSSASAHVHCDHMSFLCRNG